MRLREGYVPIEQLSPRLTPWADRDRRGRGFFPVCTVLLITSPYIAPLVLQSNRVCAESPTGVLSTETWSPDRPDRIKLPSTTPTSQRYRDVLAIMADIHDEHKDEPVDGDEVARQERTLAKPIFIDSTASAFGTALAPTEPLRFGTDYWLARTDRLLGSDVLGHTGLCVGDVNGDGRDDLYVPQMGSLPNLLLVQNEDGTVTDRAKEAGVDLLDMTRACLLVDMDNDGDQDLVLSIRNATVIYENDGKGNFGGSEHKPVLNARTGTPSEFYSMAAADYDHNKFVDLYSVRYVKATYGVSIPLPYHDANNGPPNHLLANLGGWKFDDVTDRVGLNQNNSRFSLAAAWEDFDEDGDQDLYVANDFGKANLYVNNGGKFTDEAAERGAINQAAGMGVTWADYDLDGHVDLYVSNMFSPPGIRVMSRPEFRKQDSETDRRQFLGHAMGNSLYRNLGGGKFENASNKLRVEIGGWSWGAMFIDFNNDGYEDLLVPNGNLSGPIRDDIDSLFWRRVAPESPLTATAAPKYEDGWAAMSLLMNDGYSWAGHQRNVTYLNLGNGAFADISMVSGFGYIADARALAVTDWDNDGDLDVWVKYRTAPMLRFLRNLTRENADARSQSHFVSFELQGIRCNRQAIGARVTVEAGGRQRKKTVRAGEGYLAQSSHRVHFGLGSMDRIELVTVNWPGDEREEFKGLQVDRAYRLVQGKGPSPDELAPRDQMKIGQSTGAIAPAAPEPDSLRRIVLQDRLPVPGFGLETVDGRKTNTESKLGRPCVWFFWSARSPRSLAALRTLSLSMGRLRDHKAEVIPVCVDEAAFLDAARQAARDIDENLPLIPMTPELIDFLDVVQQEILGRPEDLFLPTTLVVDRLGLLVSLQRGGVDVDALIEDIQRKHEDRHPFNGRVLFPPKRSYAFLAQQFHQRGQAGLADYYGQLARRANAGGER